MCIQYIKNALKKKFGERPDKEVERWKVIRVMNGKIYPCFINTPYKTGWNKAVNSQSAKVLPIKGAYIPGFHVFRKKKDAVDYWSSYARKPIKVICSGKLVSGTIDGVDVEAYQFMMIPDKEIERCLEPSSTS